MDVTDEITQVTEPSAIPTVNAVSSYIKNNVSFPTIYSGNIGTGTEMYVSAIDNIPLIPLWTQGDKTSNYERVLPFHDGDFENSAKNGMNFHSELVYDNRLTYNFLAQRLKVKNLSAEHLTGELPDNDITWNKMNHYFLPSLNFKLDPKLGAVTAISNNTELSGLAFPPHYLNEGLSSKTNDLETFLQGPGLFHFQAKHPYKNNLINGINLAFRESTYKNQMMIYSDVFPSNRLTATPLALNYQINQFLTIETATSAFTVGPLEVHCGVPDYQISTINYNSSTPDTGYISGHYGSYTVGNKNSRIVYSFRNGIHNLEFDIPVSFTTAQIPYYSNPLMIDLPLFDLKTVFNDKNYNFSSTIFNPNFTHQFMALKGTTNESGAKFLSAAGAIQFWGERETRILSLTGSTVYYNGICDSRLLNSGSMMRLFGSTTWYCPIVK